MIVALSSLRGSPGVTSWSLLLAGAWPIGVERVVLEADGDGGVLAVRCGLGVDPGVAALVAATRRHDAQTGRVTVDAFARRLGDEVWVIPGPESAERAAAVWASSADDVAAMAALDRRVWIVDGGRSAAGALAAPFTERAELAVVLTSARQEDLVAVPPRVRSLQGGGAAAVGVLVVGRPGYGLDELRAFFGTGLVWMVRVAGDAALTAPLTLSSRRARRSWLWREAVDVAAAFAERVEPAVDGVEVGEPADG